MKDGKHIPRPTGARKQKSVFEPGEVEANRKDPVPTANPGDTYPDSLYAKRAELMQRGCGTKSQRRNSFNSTHDIGKDHQMTKKEKFLMGVDKLLHLQIPMPSKHHKEEDDHKKKKESDLPEFGAEDEESMRYFNLRHLFTREDSDAYAATYERSSSTNDNKHFGDALNLMVVGTAMAHNR